MGFAWLLQEEGASIDVPAMLPSKLKKLPHFSQKYVKPLVLHKIAKIH
jgi:hypothetical protein